MYYLKRVNKKDLAPRIKKGMWLVVNKKKSYKKQEVVLVKNKNKSVNVRRIYLVHKHGIYEVRTDKQKLSKSQKISYKTIKGSIVKIYSKKFGILLFSFLFLFFGAIIGTLLFLKFSNSAPTNIVVSSSDTRPTTVKPTLKPKNFTLGSVQKDIVYCNSQAFDLYQPRVAKYQSQPSVIYFHGGGWRNNSKSSEQDQLDLIDGLRDKGFTIISADYRKAPDFTYPAQIQDVTCLVRFLKTNAEKYNLDENKIGVYGFSAGGQLAAMLGVLNDNTLFNNGEYNSKNSKVMAVVTLAGIFDFENAVKSNNLFNIQALNIPESANNAAPITYIDKNDSPFFLIHGEYDQFVLPEQDIIFGNKLKEAGVNYKYLLVKNAEHGLNPRNGDPIPSRNAVGDQIKQFFIDNMAGPVN